MSNLNQNVLTRISKYFCCKHLNANFNKSVVTINLFVPINMFNSNVRNITSIISDSISPERFWNDYLVVILIYVIMHNEFRTHVPSSDGVRGKLWQFDTKPFLELCLLGFIVLCCCCDVNCLTWICDKNAQN